MKKIFIIIFIFFLSARGMAQDTILSRIIFIGDAGTIGNGQPEIIADAASRIISGKTTVVYLGNNVYSRNISSSPNVDKSGENTLSSQFQPMRDRNAAVIFTFGNKDWNNSRPGGVAKALKEQQFLESQNDSLIRTIPHGVCPEPVAIPVSDQVVMIFLDTEWWLSLHRPTPDEDCEITSKRDIEAMLSVMAEQYKGKTILLITHHPFITYGNHGGKFSWKDHLFPLTAANKDLYLPLPVVGSLYPLFRKAFPKPQDLLHPSHTDMVRIISDVFKHSPNFVQISAHENGLQLIQNPHTGLMQIVAGIGRKVSYIKKGTHTIFGSANPGYVIADLLPDNRIHFTFYDYKKDRVQEAYNFTRNQHSVTEETDSAYADIAGDSTYQAAHPEYNDMGKFGRVWFGENYRAAWATPARLPILRMSEVHGGLHPIKLGGGFQTISVRLADSTGTEYVLRSVEKVPDIILPREFRGTFARGLAEDLFSAQHPYSALIVPPIAQSAGVPHTHPVIGVVAPDTILGPYQKLFAGKISLLEEREPLGNSDNFTKAFKKLEEDNDNRFDGINYLRARMIDLLIADWDRHDDQWRFYDQNKKGSKNYLIVPRDRDQALNLTEGIIPWYGKHYILMPHVFGFRKRLLPGSKYYLMENGIMNAYPASQIGYRQWMQTAQEFKDQITDSVLKVAVGSMPSGLSTAENDKISEILQVRRDQIPEAMDKYYRFSNKIVDIRGSNKREFISINNVEDSDALHILMRKISKKGILEDTLMSKTYPRKITREIRLYLFKGADSVLIDNTSSTVKLRIIGGKGEKSYNVIHSRKTIKIYDYKQENYSGQTGRLKKRISRDSSNIDFVPVNLYNTYTPTLTGGINPDDGLLLGVGVRILQQRGFRKVPYTAVHRLSVMHSFSTSAFRIKYRGEWPGVFSKAGFIITGDIMAPENKQNFFGAGNQTTFNKTGDFRRFYRARFNLFSLAPALAWNENNGGTFSIGPSIQYYHYNPANNTNRFISMSSELHSFDSAMIDKDKTHLGLAVNYQLDDRDTTFLPAYGVFLNISMTGNVGMNKFSKSYGQLLSDFAFYKNLNPARTVILANRIGGVVTTGKPAFYQYAYLGGQENLLGYRQFRFAGQYSLYNNLELRAMLTNFGNHLFRGQLGLIGFYDVGKVWIDGEHSRKWHQGAGGGIYLTPASLMVFRFLVGHSYEGWYPYAGIGFRF